MQAKLFFDKGPHPMFLIDKETLQILSANEKATEVYGFTRAKFLSMKITDLIYTEDVKSTYKHKSTIDYNYFAGVCRHRKKNGTLFYIKSAFQLIDYNNIKAIYLSCVEIQEEYAVETGKPLTKKTDISEAYLNALTDSQSSYLIRVDLDGNYNFANNAFFQKFGFTEKEIIDQPLLPTIVEEDHEKVGIVINDCLRSPGKEVSLKLKKPDKTGRLHITDWTFVAIRNPKGEVVEIQGMGQDITQEFSYHHQLRATEDRLENLLATVDDIIWSADPNNYHIIYINQTCKKITGYNQKDFYNNGPLWNNIIHPDDQEALRSMLIQLMNTKESVAEYRIIHKNGSIRNVRLKAILRKDNNGNPVSITGTLVDITTQTKSLKLVKEREQFIDHILSTIPGTVYLHNPKQGLTHFLNTNVLNLLSTGDRFTTIPKNILSDLCHPNDQEKLYQHYQKIIESNSLKQSYKIMIRVRNNGGNMPSKWLMLNEVILRKDEGNQEIFEILGIATDITELRQKEIEAQQTNEKLGLAVQIAQLGISYFHLEKQYILLDEASKEMLGQKEEKLSIAKFIEQVALPFQAGITSLIFHYDSNQNKRISFTYNLTGGRTKYFKIVFSLLSKEKGFTVLIGAIFDETEEKEKEQSLKKKNEEIIRTHQQVVEYKLMALQSIMNPHFLFNSLNSIQFLIAKRQREDALNYLSLFSELLRNVIDSSISGTLLLGDEVEMLHHYLELEKLRFEDKFDYFIEIDEELRRKQIRIPPLLIQPFVENAILHGIKNKEGKGHLRLKVQQKNTQLLCIVEDDGIGREKALKIKENSTIKHTSVGVMLTKERLKLINSRHPVNVEIEDLYNESGEANGTRIKIYIEIN